MTNEVSLFLDDLKDATSAKSVVISFDKGRTNLKEQGNQT